jgi:hypothetical protein
MPTSSFTKFVPAIETILEAGNLGSETWAVKLATAIDATAGTFTEVANGNGYTTGGNSASVSTATQSGGTYKLVLADPAAWTGASAGFSFQYAVLVGSSSGAVGSWNYGSSQAVGVGETVTVDLDATNGVLQGSIA